jgi:hypothetical protein
VWVCALFREQLFSRARHGGLQVREHVRPLAHGRMLLCGAP